MNLHPCSTLQQQQQQEGEVVYLDSEDVLFAIQTIRKNARTTDFSSKFVHSTTEANIQTLTDKFNVWLKSGIPPKE